MFEQRSNELELMDTDAFDADLADGSFRFIENINRFFGGTRIVWNFVREQALRLDGARPLRVLDVGAGSCDIAITVCRRAIAGHLPLEMVCVERDRHAVARAREHLSRHTGLPIAIEHADIFDHHPAEPYDVAVMSMFIHHLDDTQIRALIAHLGTFVRERALINELGRCWPNYVGASALCLFQPRGVRNDALLSVRKGFLPREVLELTEPLSGVTASASWAWPFRVRAELSFSRGADGT